VSAGEVEEVLMRIPEVAEAAVTGEPDALLGEAIVAHVATKEPVEASAILAFCRKALPLEKAPKRVVLHDVLPKTPNGKVDRLKLGA
jgi:acyl-CoA synthetase (AMP-forming)/AMP-acid ligase II